MNYSIFSRYRTELMGIAILNVMMLHALSWTKAIEHPNMVVLALNTFGRLIFTEGFLFFSGLGIYYSLTNNSNIRDFYERRMKRLMVPYIIIASPFFLYQWVSGKYEIDILLLKLSSLFFWIQGNDGMWYISLSLVLYMFSPLIYKALSFSGGGILCILLSVIGIYLIWRSTVRYYELIEIGITKVPFFILGVYCGKFSKEEKRIHWSLYVMFVVLLCLLYTLPRCEWLDFRECTFRLVGMLTCATILLFATELTTMYKLLKWFGKYTLELYIFHMLIFEELSMLIENRYWATGLTIAVSIVICRPVHQGIEKYVIKKL